MRGDDTSTHTSEAEGRAGFPSTPREAAAVSAPVRLPTRTGPLLWLVFLAGIGSMAVEICASRLLAPYYGSSTIVWANIIGLVLASLSLGYWLGGRLADHRPSSRVLGGVVLAAAVLIAVIPFAARPFLDVTMRGLDAISAGAVVGSLLASLILFVPPVLLLGMVTPFAIRLAVPRVEDAGRVAGRVFALSTVGSLLGTFLPALLLIPLIGTQRTMIAAAVVVALAAAFLLGSRWLLAGVVLAALLLIPPGVVKAIPGLIAERESRYQFIQVAGSANAHYLYLNEGVAVHSTWYRHSVLTGGEWDMFLTLPALIGQVPRRMAMLGNAGGTTARAYGALFPTTRYDGVEIDPAVSDFARRYFGLGDSKRFTLVSADARPYLTSTGRRYDVIGVDAYRQPYVPFYLATREFFRLARERLASDGVLALNVTTLPGDDRLARAIAGTLAWEFPQVLTWRALEFNTLVVGLSHPLPLATVRSRLRAAQGPVRPLDRLFAAHFRVARRMEDPWTDDRAPVEWLTDRMIVDYAARGGSVGEHLLPTAP
jgi:spermidine synthase